jgi:UDP-2,4-diacetamido-2,4,6-trideoxy-beta-L-altropyranose hydrolase
MRTDAASHIGIGHVMRCLTLANALKEKGAEVSFICRPFAGHLGERIVADGHDLNMLPLPTQVIKPFDPLQTPYHANWLGESWETDLAQTQMKLNGEFFDWMIVDHYSLDARWESVMRTFTGKLMVIDDLADRSHDCDLLLDPTFGRTKEAYKSKVPDNCIFMMGSKYVLLRPEFLKLREFSLNRRKRKQVKHLLITFGGIDYSNATGHVLEVLKNCSLPKDFRITIVMGEAAPWLDMICEQADKLIWKTEIKVNVSNMAQLMAESDLAIGSAGTTSWERCCLGLPTIMIVLAANQRSIGFALKKERAVILLNKISEVEEAIGLLSDSAEELSRLSQVSRNITDGSGVEKIVHYMEQLCAKE